LLWTSAKGRSSRRLCLWWEACPRDRMSDHAVGTMASPVDTASTFVRRHSLGRGARVRGLHPHLAMLKACGTRSRSIRNMFLVLCARAMLDINVITPSFMGGRICSTNPANYQDADPSTAYHDILPILIATPAMACCRSRLRLRSLVVLLFCSRSSDRYWHHSCACFRVCPRSCS